MKATELWSVLSNLSEVLRAGGASQSAKDVALLSERIDVSDGKSASLAIQELETELTATKPVKLPPQRYISAFLEAGTSEEEFDKIFVAFRSDRSIKKADAMVIMKGYAGRHSQADTKADAIDEIQRHFSKLLYNANEQRQASSSPW